MSKFAEVKARIAEESNLRPAERRQMVPCAFCVRGGNGDRSCSCGTRERRYSQYKGCFAGTMLETEGVAK